MDCVVFIGGVLRGGVSCHTPAQFPVSTYAAPPLAESSSSVWRSAMTQLVERERRVLVLGKAPLPASVRDREVRVLQSSGSRSFESDRSRHQRQTSSSRHNTVALHHPTDNCRGAASRPRSSGCRRGCRRQDPHRLWRLALSVETAREEAAAAMLMRARRWWARRWLWWARRWWAPRWYQTRILKPMCNVGSEPKMATD